MVDLVENDSNKGGQSGSNAGPDSDAAISTMTAEQFLSMIGARVRKSRMEINMSRKLLAKRSGVSERYLAQLESGQGNISIKLLRKVALAIGVRLDVLMSELEGDYRGTSTGRPEFIG